MNHLAGGMDTERGREWLGESQERERERGCEKRKENEENNKKNKTIKINDKKLK